MTTLTGPTNAFAFSVRFLLQSLYHVHEDLQNGYNYLVEPFLLHGIPTSTHSHPSSPHAGFFFAPLPRLIVPRQFEASPPPPILGFDGIFFLQTEQPWEMLPSQK
ncbi:hypothetical protein VNO77_08730 [Canavalia gladiata]|uniref:Uncharacterized protein n=1 Tax=Canavalia gladiata TaxID=3824 RepID=A0AAN9ME72_CANGL